MSLSAIRNLWRAYQMENSDNNDSNTDEEEEELERRKQLSINLSHTLRTRQLLINYHGGQPVLSLRAPLDLVDFTTISCPRWPIECEVISDAIQHIEWDPPEPEPFYQSTGGERTPMPVGAERGKVVYCSDSATKRPYFTCSRFGGSRGTIKSATSHDNQAEFTLEFESRFESGNLQKAVQVGIYDYELTLRTDMYTMKHTQWFYFRVRNMKAGVTYRFTIINLMKNKSLYNQGMKPLLYSERAAQEDGVGWQHTGSNIRYYRNCRQNTKDSSSDPIALYSLTWTLQFPYASDTCYVSHCYPYTYSQLQCYLRKISSNPTMALYCKVRVLCQSLAGNAVYVLTITSWGDSRHESRNKKAVVVTARVHPGETNSSWIMEGFLDFLLGDSDDAQVLRDNFVFKVVPMLNPDGVVVGNYRCSLAGRDLNRNYKTVLKDYFPCVWHTRKMVERLMAEMDVVLYCDFHGHNRKNNVFMYGCNNHSAASLNLQERVFPLMMSKNANNKFSFRSCKFRVQKSKEGTGRIVMWRLGIKNSYTMEATFGGSTLDNRRGTHFTTGDLKSLGFYFCDTLLDFCDPDPTKVTYCLTELAELLQKEIRERTSRDLGAGSNISISDLETNTSGSNSSDSDGPPAHLLHQPQALHPEKTQVKKKKKHLRTRKERNKLQKDRESNKLLDNAVDVSIQENPAGRHRRNLQLKGLVRKNRISPPTTNPREVSRVTLLQHCKTTEDDCLENLRFSYQNHKTKACSHHSTHTAVSLHSRDQVMHRKQHRCSSQLLHLNTLFLPPLNFIQPKPQQRHCHRQPFTSSTVHRGLAPSIPALCRSSASVCVQMVPEIVPMRSLLTAFTTNEFGGRHILRASKSVPASDRHLMNSRMSKTDISTIKHENEDWSDSSQDSTHLY